MHRRSWLDGSRRLLAAGAALALLAAQAPAAAAGERPPAGGGPSAGAVAGSLLVTSGDLPVQRLLGDAVGSLRRTDERLRHASARPLGPRVALVRVPPGWERLAARVLAAVPGVVAVEPDRLRRFQAVPDDPHFPLQWAHQQTGVTGAWDRQTGSRTVRVAVLDSGVRGDHPDLRANVVEQVDASTGTIVTTATGSDNDSCGIGHGTAVAGVLGAVGDNGVGVAGVAWQVGIVDVAVTSSRAGATCDGVRDSAVLAGIDHAVRGPGGPVDVVNMSFGGYQDVCPTALRSAIADARAAGVVMVAAAGNGELDPATAGRTAMPASCGGVLSVGATGPDVTRAAYSTTNAHLDLVAPGGDWQAHGADGLVRTTAWDYQQHLLTGVQGTSFSAPYVAGVAALLRAERPDAGPAEVDAALIGTAEDLGPPGRDHEYGWGLVHPAAALQAVAGEAAPEPPAEPAPPEGPEPPADSEPPAEPAPPEGPEPPAATLERVSGGGPTTAPVTQAVAVSRRAFAPGGAAHVLVARDDDYADALSGSTLGAGAGPLLFTARAGPLAAATRAELQRVLPPGGRVYLLGGTVALPVGLEAELAELAYRAVRLAGTTREHTAALVAAEVRRRLPELDLPTARTAIVATRQNWPDAVAAGSLGALLGAPILLTPADALHPDTAVALRALELERLLVVGGRLAVSEATATEAAQAAGVGQARRLGGPARDATAVAVAEEAAAAMASAAGGPETLIATNLRRADGYAHVLSASTLAVAERGVFVPVEGAAGTILTPASEGFVRAAAGVPAGAVVLAGGEDLVAQAVGERIRELLGAGH